MSRLMSVAMTTHCDQLRRLLSEAVPPPWSSSSETCCDCLEDADGGWGFGDASVSLRHRPNRDLMTFWRDEAALPFEAGA